MTSSSCSPARRCPVVHEDQWMTQARALAERARVGARALSMATTEQKNRALTKLTELLTQRFPQLREANQLDLEAARQAGIAPAMLDRLELTEKRLQTMVAGVRDVI